MPYIVITDFFNFFRFTIFLHAQITFFIYREPVLCYNKLVKHPLYPDIYFISRYSASLFQYKKGRKYHMKKRNITISSSLSSPDFLSSATGPITIRLTNDYLFRALLQHSNKALIGLICALLHLKPEQIQSAVITNPIELGSAIDEKTFILDVKVILNNSIIINLEMQVINEYNWPERSLSYLCRAFNNLNPGEDYHKVKPVVQIGLLDFTLFPEYPEFYATYQFLNIKTTGFIVTNCAFLW